MTDIILLQTRYGFYDAMGVRPPTAMLSVAAVPCHFGYKVVLIDQRTNPDWKDEVKKHLSGGARVVCLTAIAGEQIRFMMGASRFVKSVNPEVTVFLGGTWAQTEPEMCLQDENVDIVCYGEGDYLLPEIMDYCVGKRKIEDIKGIVYRAEDGAVKKNPARPPIENLDDLPKTPYNLVNLNDYSALGFRPGSPSISFTVSRGCGHRCQFCSIPSLYGRKWRSHSVGRVMDDLSELEAKYGIKDFFFMDDNIAGDYKWFSELISRLAASGKDYYWSAAGIRAPSILRLTDKDMENLLKSGCKTLDIGVESGNERILKLIQKDITLDVVQKANRKLKDYPLLIKYTFMAGFPTETEEEYLDTLKFRRILLEENEHALAPIFNYTPYPKTPLFELALSEGLQLPKTLLGWADFNYYSWYRKYPSWLTKSMICLIENTVFLSYFDTYNLNYKYTNPLMKTVFKLYYPIAKFRGDHNFYAVMLEKWAADFVRVLNDRLDLFNRSQKKRLPHLNRSDHISKCVFQGGNSHPPLRKGL